MSILPAESVQTVLTSPPYWSLRDYRVDDQIGCDDDLRAYINSIVDMFAVLRCVLRDDGTVWLNIGDASRPVTGGIARLTERIAPAR